MTVVAAVVEEDGRFLVTARLAGTHLAGLWEFPGGKVAPGETHAAALVREMREELAASVVVDDLILSTVHEYADRTVALYFYRCTLADRPRPVLGQQMRWATAEDLATLEFPPADGELIEMLTRRP